MWSDAVGNVCTICKVTMWGMCVPSVRWWYVSFYPCRTERRPSPRCCYFLLRHSWTQSPSDQLLWAPLLATIHTNKYTLKVRTLATALLTDSKTAALYSFRSDSWLAWANDIAVHYVAIHCPRKRTTGPAVQLADIPPPQSVHTRPSPHSQRQVSYYSFPIPLRVGGW